MEITSINNDLVKDTVKLQQKKYREETGKFLLEGFKSIEEAYLSKIKFEKLFVEKNKVGKYRFLNCEIIETNEMVLKKISTTDSAPEAVGVAFQKDNSFDNIGEKVLLLEDIKDLGNLGTIIRTAVGFGVDTIILYGETVDIYNPKVVRSAVGNLWKINIVHMENIEQLNKYFGEFDRFATLPKSDNVIELSKLELKNKSNLIMFGSEASGLSVDLKEFATSNVTIKTTSDIESLNLSISVGIVLYNLFLNK